MSEKDVIKRALKDKLHKLFKERGIIVDKIIIFGSFVKGGFTSIGDIDLYQVSFKMK